MSNSIIEGLNTYFKSYSGITGTGSQVLTDFLEKIPTNYDIVPLGGSRVVEEYLDNSKTCQFAFAFQSMSYTLKEAERMDNQGFMEDLADWLDAQTASNNLPVLPSGKTAERIGATGNAYLAQEHQTTGVYLIQCVLIYKQD